MIRTGMGAAAPNPKDRKSFCGTIGAPPMRSFGRKPRFPRRPPSALRGNIKQSENGPSGPRRQSGADFQAIHLPKIYTITWGPRKNRVFVGKCCEFPPRNPTTLRSWGFAPPLRHPGSRRTTVGTGILDGPHEGAPVGHSLLLKGGGPPKVVED